MARKGFSGDEINRILFEEDPDDDNLDKCSDSDYENTEEDECVEQTDNSDNIVSDLPPAKFRKLVSKKLVHDIDSSLEEENYNKIPVSDRNTHIQ